MSEAERQRIVARAREWVGTPFHHQAAVKGVGCDCIGFLKGLALELGYITSEDLAQMPANYSSQPQGELLRHQLARYLRRVPKGAEQPGDIFLMRFSSDDQHLALFTGYGIIHAAMTRQQVIEHRLDSRWRGYVRAVYAFPALAEEKQHG